MNEASRQVGRATPTSKLDTTVVEVCMSFYPEASVAEEPGAEKPHAGICVGGVEQSASLLRWQ
jgi:hypothetical protein